MVAKRKVIRDIRMFWLLPSVAYGGVIIETHCHIKDTDDSSCIIIRKKVKNEIKELSRFEFKKYKFIDLYYTPSIQELELPELKFTICSILKHIKLGLREA